MLQVFRLLMLALLLMYLLLEPILEEERLITRERISQLESRLPKGYLRIHRSYIINPLKAEALSKQEVLIGGEQLNVSRTYKEAVVEYLSNGQKKAED